MNNNSEAILKQGHELKIIAIATPKINIKKNQLPADYIQNTGIEIVFVDTNLYIADAIKALLSGKSYNLSRFYSKQVEDIIAVTLKKQTFDIILLESLFVCPYIPVIREHSKAKLIYRSHNIEHKIWLQLSNQTSNPLKKIYLRVLARQLRNFETNILADAVACISENDERYYRSITSKPVQVISFGLNISMYPYIPAPRKISSFFHLGSMDWQPNIDGINWFIEKVWNAGTFDRKQARLFLAGKNMPPAILQKRSDSIITEGFINDPLEYMKSKDVLVVPLFSGSGVRIKIIEAMALGKTVLSTSKGAEGIPYTHQKNILIADSEMQFSAMITDLINGNIDTESIGKEARWLIEQNYSLEGIGKKLDGLFAQTIQQS